MTRLQELKQRIVGLQKQREEATEEIKRLRKIKRMVETSATYALDFERNKPVGPGDPGAYNG